MLVVKALGFLVVAIVVGVRLAPVFFIRSVERMQVRGSLIVYAVLFCTVLAMHSPSRLPGVQPMRISWRR
jgi:hypothetical protein